MKKVRSILLFVTSFLISGCFYHEVDTNSFKYKKMSFQKYLNYYTKAEKESGRGSFSSLPKTASAHIEIKPYSISFSSEHLEHSSSLVVEGNLTMDCNYTYVMSEGMRYYSHTFEKIAVDGVDYTECEPEIKYLPYHYGEPRYVPFGSFMEISETETDTFLWQDIGLYYHPSDEEVFQDGETYLVNSYEIADYKIQAKKVFVKPAHRNATYYYGENYLGMDIHYKYTYKEDNEKVELIISKRGIRTQYHWEEKEDGITTISDVSISW